MAYLLYINWWFGKIQTTISINNSWTIIYNTWVNINTWDLKLVISWNCSINDISNYRTLDIFWEGNTLKTPSTRDLKGYTREISISWYVEEAYICVISDIRADYKKYKAYAFSTYLYLWDANNAGNINVWYSKENRVVYDSSTWWPQDPFIDGRFRWNEAPYTQVVNLSGVIVANMVNWWKKIIYPIRLFNDWATIRVGGYTNSYPNRRAGEITKLRIIYKWWSISLLQ